MSLSGNKTQYMAVAALIASMVIWSVSGIAIKQALAVLPPFTMIVMRFVPSVLLMFIIGMICRKSDLFRLQRMDIKDLPLFLIAGFCQPFLYYLLETFSYKALNSPTVAETLLSTSPLLSPIFAAVLLRERVTRNNIIGILISTAGVFTLTLIEQDFHLSTFNSQLSIGSYWGVLLAFAAVSAAVVDSIMMRKIPARYSALTIIFYAQLVSLCFFIPIWFVREGPAALTALDWSQLSISPSAVNSPFSILHSQLALALLSVGYLTVFASVFAFILFCYALRIVGVTQANAFNNIRPAFTALWMIIFFGERLPWVKWIGMILIILGLFVCQKEEKVSNS